MFDIGFTELIVIGVVALLVIGPERLPSTIRTASLWLNRIRRGFNDIKQEVKQELHNDSVIQELRETGQRLKQDTESIGQGLQKNAQAMTGPADQAAAANKPTVKQPDPPPEKSDE